MQGPPLVPSLFLSRRRASTPGVGLELTEVGGGGEGAAIVFTKSHRVFLERRTTTQLGSALVLDS